MEAVLIKSIQDFRKMTAAIEGSLATIRESTDVLNSTEQGDAERAMMWRHGTDLLEALAELQVSQLHLLHALNELSGAYWRRMPMERK